MGLLEKIITRRQYIKQLNRLFAKTAQEPKTDPNSINAWQITNYGKLDKLQMMSIKRPIITQPNEVLVRISASSVNPIDIEMLGGYGNVLLDVLRKFDMNCERKVNLPMTLGRDFCGQIVEKGNTVRTELKVGDTIYGVIPPHFQGCHAEYVVADEGLVAHKPEHLSDEEAAGILYTSMTAWSALNITGDLAFTGAKSKRVLVIGGSGAVGTAAIQMLKAWGAEVITTCRKDAIPVVEKLNADLIVDYSQSSWLKDIQAVGKYDIILDASGNVTPATYIPLLNEWNNSKFITLRSPLLKNTDKYGLLVGMVQNLGDLIMSNINTGAISRGTSVRWGFFIPINMGVTEIADMVRNKQLTPVVEKIFPFKDLPLAFDRVIEGHLRGKLIMTLK